VPAEAALPPEYVSWTFPRGLAVARGDLRAAVEAALAQSGSLYRWAASRPGHEVFSGRGETYGVELGGVAAVVRHARRGGYVMRVWGDIYWGAPRVYREIQMSRRLAEVGVSTPAVLAGVVYRALIWHRADVATSRVAGLDLATLLFGPEPPRGTARERVWFAVGRLVRRLHDAGFSHPDLQLRNVLVNVGGGSAAATAPGGLSEAHLLDVETVEPIGRSQLARRRNLARFYRSWEKWNRRRGARLTADDRAAFEAAYSEAAE
jgi:3-deoxy-D-manno-octulosonic acid kinase